MSRPSESLPLVARGQELAALDAALARARSGRSATVLVAGDAGVGKSRLVAALTERARAAGALVLVGHCIDVGGVGLPYLPFAQVLAAVHRLAATREDARAALESRPVLDSIAGGRGQSGTGGDDVGRLQLLDAVSGLLADLSATDAGAVLVLEDLHWADQSTRELLRYLVARAGDARLLVVGTYRSDDLHRRHPLRALLPELLRQPSVERLDVRPFTEGELRQFLAAIAGDAVDEERLQDVLRRSEGNAYFAEELLEAGGGALTEQLTDVLTARTERLGTAAQHLVRLASVAGRQVDEPLLQAVHALLPGPGPAVDGDAGDGAPTAPGAATDAALRDAVTHRVLVADEQGRLAFRHALLAEAVYGDLLPGERVRIHAAYARAIRADLRARGAGLGAAGPGGAGPLGSAAELAHHALAGNDLPEALSASTAAADEAARRLAPAETLRHLESVLQLWSAVPDAAERVGHDLVAVTLRAAEAAGRCGELARAVALARAAVEQAGASGDAAAQSTAWRVLASHLMALDQPGWLEPTERAVELLTGRPARQLPQVAPHRDLVLAAAIHARGNLYAERDGAAHEWATWTLEAARALGMPAAEADALTTLAQLSTDRRARADLLQQARRRAAEAGELTAELRSAFSVAAETFYAGDAAGALAELRAGQERARATGTTWSVWGVELRVLEVVALYVAGDWDGSASAGALVGDTPPDIAAARLAAAALYVRTGRGEADPVGAAQLLRPSWALDGQIALVGGGCLVDALSWVGRPADAFAVAGEVIGHLARTWDDFFLGGIWLSCLALSALADARGAPGRGGPAAGRPLAGGPVAGGPMARRPVAGDADATEREADRLLEHAQQTAGRGRPRGGVLGPEGRAWLTRAHAEHARAHGRDDVDAWRRAVEAFAGWYPYEEARSRRRLAEALLGSGDRQAAAEEVAAALETADRLGAGPLRDALHDLSRRGRLGVAAADASASRLLTARESEVLALVARGLTNRAVGQRLFISEKTVSVHLSNVMAKLGASGRTEAVSLAHRRGLLPDGMRADVSAPADPGG